jgi:hypothetical protein
MPTLARTFSRLVETRLISFVVAIVACASLFVGGDNAEAGGVVHVGKWSASSDPLR